MEQSDAYDIELIERYINGDLKGKELEVFETRIKEDTKLAEKINQVRALPNSLEVAEKDRLAKQVKKWMKADAINDAEKELTIGKKKSSRTLYLKIIGVAAITLLLFFATGLLNISIFAPNLETQAQNYIEQHHQSPIVLRASTNEQWEQAIQSYNNDDFGQVIGNMKPIIDSGNATAEQNFYFALAHLYTDPAQYNVALEYLNKTEKEDPSAYAEEIAWYLGLIFIRKNELEKAKTELAKIKSSDRYGNKVDDLLQAME